MLATESKVAGLGATMGPRNNPKQITVQEVSGGYIITGSWPFETVVAFSIQEVLDIVKAYLEKETITGVGHN